MIILIRLWKRLLLATCKSNVTFLSCFGMLKIQIDLRQLQWLHQEPRMPKLLGGPRPQGRNDGLPAEFNLRHMQKPSFSNRSHGQPAQRSSQSGWCMYVAGLRQSPTKHRPGAIVERYCRPGKMIAGENMA